MNSTIASVITDTTGGREWGGAASPNTWDGVDFHLFDRATDVRLTAEDGVVNLIAFARLRVNTTGPITYKASFTNAPVDVIAAALHAALRIAHMGASPARVVTVDDREVQA